MPVKLLESPDREELPVEPEAVERDRGIEQAIHAQGMHILGRALGIGEREVALKELVNVVSSRVVNGG